MRQADSYWSLIQYYFQAFLFPVTIISKIPHQNLLHKICMLIIDIKHLICVLLIAITMNDKADVKSSMSHHMIQYTPLAEVNQAIEA